MDFNESFLFERINFPWDSAFAGLYDGPFVSQPASWNRDELIFKGVSLDDHSTIAVFLLSNNRPFRRRLNELLFDQSSSCSLHNIDWCLWIDVMGMVRSSLNCLFFVSWPGAFVVMHMSSLHHIHFVLVHEVLEMQAKVSDIFVSPFVRGVERSMHSHNDPFDAGVISCMSQVVFQKVVLV